MTPETPPAPVPPAEPPAEPTPNPEPPIVPVEPEPMPANGELFCANGREAALGNGVNETYCARLAGGKAACATRGSELSVLTYRSNEDVTDVMQVVGFDYANPAHCVLLTDGAVKCGRQGTINDSAAVESGAVSLVGGFPRPMALVNEGGKRVLYAMTSDNQSEKVEGLPDVSLDGVWTGYHQICAVAAGDLYCWSDTGTPQRVETQGKVVSVGMAQNNGGRADCAVMESGGVQCFGGVNNVDHSSVEELQNPREIAGGQYFYCAATASGAVQCVGIGGQSGSLGTISGVSDAIALAGGKNYACAETASHEIYCWGSLLGGDTPTKLSVAGGGTFEPYPCNN